MVILLLSRGPGPSSVVETEEEEGRARYVNHLLNLSLYKIITALFSW